VSPIFILQEIDTFSQVFSRMPPKLSYAAMLRSKADQGTLELDKAPSVDGPEGPSSLVKQSEFKGPPPVKTASGSKEKGASGNKENRSNPKTSPKEKSKPKSSPQESNAYGAHNISGRRNGGRGYGRSNGRGGHRYHRGRHRGQHQGFRQQQQMVYNRYPQQQYLVTYDQYGYAHAVQPNGLVHGMANMHIATVCELYTTCACIYSLYVRNTHLFLLS